MNNPEPEVLKQVDDNVQSSALGAVNPRAEHPNGDRLVPVSAATPDSDPKAERIAPPQQTGHGIASGLAKEELDGPYRKLPVRAANVVTDDEVIARNIAGAQEDDAAELQRKLDRVTEEAKSAKQAVEGGVDKPVATGDTPFPRATPGLPEPSTTKGASSVSAGLPLVNVSK